MLEYDEFLGDGLFVPDEKYYLQIPVREGKRDRTELEKWMTVAMIFIATHAAVKQQRVLIHCAQGKDRSVAVAIAALCLFCNVLSVDLGFHPWCSSLTMESLLAFLNSHGGATALESADGKFRRSGLDKDLVDILIGREGRNLLFSWIRSVATSQANNAIKAGEYKRVTTGLLATKDSVRLSLHVIQQYRDKACPSRSTIQKLHRFFMSSEYE